MAETNRRRIVLGLAHLAEPGQLVELTDLSYDEGG